MHAVRSPSAMEWLYRTVFVLGRCASCTALHITVVGSSSQQASRLLWLLWSFAVCLDITYRMGEPFRILEELHDVGRRVHSHQLYAAFQYGGHHVLWC